VLEDQFSLTAGLLKLQGVSNAGERFTQIADAAINSLVPSAFAETQRLYGKFHGQFAILGFGKLGGREMSHGSDLDIVMVYNIDPTSDEPKERQIDKYNKLTRRIITALSINTEFGGLYEVDMALRPSGRSGPLAVSLPVFEKYYNKDAWTWEFMALSRARVVTSSSAAFAQRVSEALSEQLKNKDFKQNLASDVLDMHERLARDKPSLGFWDIKGKPGGLRDIEFIAQYLVLDSKLVVSDKSTKSMLVMAQKENAADESSLQDLINICSRYQSLLQLLKLAAHEMYQRDKFSSSFKTLLTEHCQLNSFSELERQLTRDARNVTTIFKDTIG